MTNVYKYLGVILLTLFTLGACDDNVYDHISADPQSTEQEAAQSVNGFTLTLGSDLSSAVVLTEEQLETASFEAVKATATPQLAEGATITYRLEMSRDEEFTDPLQIASVSNDNAASVSASDLNEVVKAIYGKAPKARALYMRVYYYITDGTSSVMMPEPVILGPITVTPVAPVIETEYYLIGDINGWNIEDLDAYKFNHSGKDVYEDPIFSILVNNLQGYFKIVPKSSKEAASWDGVLGNPIDGNTELTGNLIVEDAQAMQVTEPGWVKVTLNMMEYTYTIEIIGEMNLFLYVPGSHQGWKPETAPRIYSRNFDFKYDGYLYFEESAEFKFTSQPDWGGTNYGYGGGNELSTDGSAGNLKTEEGGYYLLRADLSGSPYTYSITKTEWGLIGDATIGGWDNSTPMTYDPETQIWSVTTELEAKSFKFRANNGWDINMGGDMNNLNYDGDNITVAEAGTYLVTLDLSNPTTYKATMVKQ